MAVFRRSNRRLGKRSRFYELVISPLDSRLRWLIGVVMVVAVLVVIWPSVMASDIQSGSIVQTPFISCSGEAWDNAKAAAGQPDSNPSVWTQRPGPLACKGLSVGAKTPLDAQLNLFFAQPDWPQSETKAHTGPLSDLVIRSRPEVISDSLEQLDTAATIEFSIDGGQSWLELKRLSQTELDARQVNVDLPTMSHDEIAKLRARLMVGSVFDSNRTVAVDAMSVTYTVGQEALLSLSGISGGQTVLSAQSAESVRAELGIAGNDVVGGLAAAIGLSDEPEVDFSATLEDGVGKPVIIGVESSHFSTKLNGNWQWSLDYKLPRQIEPGDYQLVTRLVTSNGEVVESSDKVLVGVVAMNFDRSGYLPGQNIEAMFSVLDERGATICDAKLTLKLSLNNQLVRELSSNQGDIAVSDTCHDYGSQIQADYLSDFSLDELGIYDVELTVETGDYLYRLRDSVQVSSQPSIVVHRTGPTRLFPVKSYPMELKVTFNESFDGTLEEVVPSSFKLLDEPDSRPYELSAPDTDTQVLKWHVQAQAGDELVLRYRFDAPDRSPAFYTLGPAQLKSADGTVIFSEPRQWQLAGDAIGRMLLLWDGGSAPSGWTCVSCSGGDPFYQRFIRGDATYGGTGGGATHTHTASGAIDATTDPMPARSNNPTPNELNNNTHTHTFSPTVGSASNLPSYRQLKVIRYDTAGQPSTLPAGAIALFDATVPSGWTRYSAQDGYYIRGENTAGTTGGSNTHTHGITGTSGAASGGLRRRATAGAQSSVAAINHTHDASGTSTSANHEPSYVETILGQLNSDSAPPNNMIAMWDDEPPSEWVHRSESGGTFYQLFIKPSASFGTTGGNVSHNHSDTAYNSGGPSATTTSRTGGTVDASDGAHVHNVDVTGFSTDSHLPPYINVVIAKKQTPSSHDQSAYRWFGNQNSTDIGSPLAALSTAASAPRQGTAFRLRLLVHISDADRDINGSGLKLQIAERSGSCDTSFIGETYVDVSPSSGDVRFFDNSTPDDGDALTTNANDPTHSSHAVIEQSYEEANNFTNNQSAIAIGEDGLWDFSLVDFSAAPSTSYCFRVIRATDELIDDYTVIPEITTDDGIGHMLLFWDGGGAPSGWSCVSCNPGDDFYQRFPRGETTYGTTGGSGNHTHTASGSVGTTTELGRGAVGSGFIRDHDHSFSPSLGSASNLPSYRQLKVIRANGSGTPGTIPAGAIAIFDAAVPSGWTRYSSQDGNHIRGENTAGTTGGSNTHSHAVSGTTSTPTNGVIRGQNTAGTQVQTATDAHTHTVSGNTQTGNNEPPYINTIFGEIDSDGSAPSGMLAMWDAAPPSAWSARSGSGDPFYQRFMVGAASYGGTGGNGSHSHANTNLTTSGPTGTALSRDGGANITPNNHTHTATISSVSTENHLPPYLNVIISELTGSNTAPNAPSSLDQIKVSDSSSISVGGWSDDVQVRFSANLTDTDNPDTLSVCVEVQPLGTGFTNTETSCGSGVAYSGSAVAATVTLLGLTDGEEYHWQARTKDSFGIYSSWVSFGANAESARDFAIDNTDPSGQVYDGTTSMVDLDVNSGSLSTLSANWSFTDNDSGIGNYDYSIGTTAGGTDLVGWTDHDTSTSATESSLSLRTGQAYFYNVRATDTAGNQVIVSSDGQVVAPTLSFSTSPDNVNFDNLNSANSYTSIKTTTLTTSTNAYGGYVVRAFINQLPTSQNGDTVPLFTGGTYAAPDAWQVGDTGYGYTSNDSLVQGLNLFGSTPCAGGGNPPCYAPFATTAPGDIVVDHTDPIQGAPLTNQNFIVSHRVTTTATQTAGTYTTLVIYTITARY